MLRILRDLRRFSGSSCGVQFLHTDLPQSVEGQKGPWVIQCMQHLDLRLAPSLSRIFALQPSRRSAIKDPNDRHDFELAAPGHPCVLTGLHPSTTIRLEIRSTRYVCYFLCFLILFILLSVILPFTYRTREERVIGSLASNVVGCFRAYLTLVFQRFSLCSAIFRTFFSFSIFTFLAIFRQLWTAFKLLQRFSWNTFGLFQTHSYEDIDFSFPHILIVLGNSILFRHGA